MQRLTPCFARLSVFTSFFSVTLYSKSTSYTKSIDPNSVILLDIATKCGFVGDAGKEDITVNYDLTLALKIAGITISPTFRSKTSFACEFSTSSVFSFLQLSYDERA